MKQPTLKETYQFGLSTCTVETPLKFYPVAQPVSSGHSRAKIAKRPLWERPL